MCIMLFTKKNVKCRQDMDDSIFFEACNTSVIIETHSIEQAHAIQNELIFNQKLAMVIDEYESNYEDSEDASEYTDHVMDVLDDLKKRAKKLTGERD